MRDRTRVTAYAGLVFGYLAVILVTTAPGHSLKVVGGLLMATVPAGAAVMSWIDVEDGVAQAGLVLIISLGVFALGGAVILWLARWHPMAPFLVIAVASIASCTLRLRANPAASGVDATSESSGAAATTGAE